MRPTSGEMLAREGDAEGALWKRSQAVEGRITTRDSPLDLKCLATAGKESLAKARTMSAASTRAIQHTDCDKTGRKMSGTGTPEDPWTLQTPPQTSEYEMWLDTVGDRDVIVCKVGKTILHYDRRCLDDLHTMLVAAGDWVELGSADEQKDAKPGTIEAWGRSAENPIGGWYGLKKGLRGRFGMYIPPLMEELGRAEVEHNPRNNRMRAV